MPPPSAAALRALRHEILCASLRHAVEIGMKLPSWNADFNVKIEKFEPKALKLLLYFLLRTIHGVKSAPVKVMAQKVKFMSSSTDEKEFRNQAIKVLGDTCKSHPLGGHVIPGLRSTELQTCSGKFPQVLLSLALVAKEVHMQKLHRGSHDTGCGDVASNTIAVYPLPSASFEAPTNLNPHELKAVVLTEQSAESAVRRLQRREANLSEMEGIIASMKEAQQREDKLKAELASLQSVPPAMDSAAASAAAVEIAANALLLEHLIPAQRPAMEGPVTWACNELEQPNTLSSELLGSDPAETIDLTQMIRQSTQEMLKTFESLGGEMGDTSQYLSDEVEWVAKSLKGEHAQYAANMSTRYNDIMAKSTRAEHSIRILTEAATQPRAPITPSRQPADSHPPSSSTESYLLPATPKPHLTHKVIEDAKLQGGADELSGPTDMCDQPQTPLSTSKVLLSVRRRAHGEGSGAVAGSARVARAQVKPMKLFQDSPAKPSAKTSTTSLKASAASMQSPAPRRKRAESVENAPASLNKMQVPHFSPAAKQQPIIQAAPKKLNKLAARLAFFEQQT